MEKLPKEFKRKWVKALRSEEYQQGYSVLFDYFNNSYCCLGVACVVAGYKPSSFSSFIDKDSYPDVPLILQKPEVIPNELARLNDAGVPFEVIAGVINEYL